MTTATFVCPLSADEHWTNEAIRGLVGQRTRFTGFGSSDEPALIVSARRAALGIEITIQTQAPSL